MARVLTTVEGVRARFSALDQPIAFFDGPGGTQVPDSVIDAIAACLRDSNANLGGAFATSRRADEILTTAHDTAASGSSKPGSCSLKCPSWTGGFSR